MNYLSLFYFIKVYEKGNMTTAAKELHLSQPCLTLRIKSLEEDYNLRLFDRTRKGVTPTNAGKILYQYAKNIVNLGQEMENHLMKVSQKITGQIRIGSTETFAAYILPIIISKYKKRYPNAHLHILVNNSQIIIKQLLNYSLDLGIVPVSSFSKRIVKDIFIRDKLVFIASKDSLWASQREIKLRDILEADLLLREEGSNTRELLLDYLMKRNINTDGLHLLDILGSNESIKCAVEQNAGISIVSESSIAKEIKLGSIVVLDVSDFNLYRDFCFVYRKESVINEAIKTFIKFCKEQSEGIFSALPG